MNQLRNSFEVLKKVAERAQTSGILSLEEAVTVKQSIDIQTNHYESLAFNEPVGSEDIYTMEKTPKRTSKVK